MLKEHETVIWNRWFGCHPFWSGLNGTRRYEQQLNRVLLRQISQHHEARFDPLLPALLAFVQQVLPEEGFLHTATQSAVDTFSATTGRFSFLDVALGKRRRHADVTRRTLKAREKPRRDAADLTFVRGPTAHKTTRTHESSAILKDM
ncbi:hypothetical protein EYF80_044007 [Liparis tanakae]|uniref:Uncharacterized protein n=1 Tax=Liparis tanakae TaxID=230148 RepID=A0A4Z2FX32_9TELE|nr:hypothetical protein EYF80_044007 [Liparis tanakae]